MHVYAGARRQSWSVSQFSHGKENKKAKGSTKIHANSPLYLSYTISFSNILNWFVYIHEKYSCTLSLVLTWRWFIRTLLIIFWLCALIIFALYMEFLSLYVFFFSKLCSIRADSEGFQVRVDFFIIATQMHVENTELSTKTYTRI